MKEKTKKRFFIVPKIAVILIALHLIATNIANLMLRAHIRSFDGVKYENQLVPQKGSERFYTFVTDDDFKIMQLNDIHLSGGFASVKRDKNVITQVMSMVSLEKPDLVILNGDSVFCVPAIGFTGGMTFNNAMTSKVIAAMFERLGVYYSITFGNHDTEVFDFTSRKNLGKLYSKDKYGHCLFESNYTGYGVSNQCILVKNKNGRLIKTIMLMDSNDYIDNSLSATINWKYDTIHDDQIQWAKDTIESLDGSKKAKKALFFFHIPVGEFETAYRNLEANNFRNTEDTKYINGYWDELVDENMGGRIWYGGCCQTEKDPEDVDSFFETLGPDGANIIDSICCAHDHVNNVCVKYKGVTLAYGYSMDNGAYTDISRYGRQRGSMIITVTQDSDFDIEYKNAYKDYKLDSTGIDTETFFYPGQAPDK